MGRKEAESSNLLENIISNIIYDYFDTFAIKKPIIPVYKIVEDIATEYLRLRPNILNQSPNIVEVLNRYNGFAIPPQKVGGEFTVLLNKNILMENINNRRMDWVGTIVHETTHVQDFYKYAQLVEAKEYEKIMQINEHGIFNLWTEINARSKGYYFTRKYTLGEDNMKNVLLIPTIKEYELATQWNMLYKQYHSTDNGYEQANLVAQYIGRLYTLQQLYPNDFDDEWIGMHFGVNDWMTNWFFFFKRYSVLESAHEHFDEMKRILGQNFDGI